MFSRFTKEQRLRITEAVNEQAGWLEYVSGEKGFLDMETGLSLNDDQMVDVLRSRGFVLEQVIYTFH